MREGKASFTAAAVSAARAIAGVDPIAPALVDGALGALVRHSVSPRWRALVNVGTLGLVDHQELRTRAVDATVCVALGAGVRQLVILGAGLDARAWRMPELAPARVLEVDHLSTQAFKRARIGGRPATAREVRFVSIDFDRDRLRDLLERAGHDAAAPTMWIWEGVTPYLPRDSVRATLADVAVRSAPGTCIAVTYATREALRAGPAFVRVARAGFRVIGEPLRGLISREEMHAELASAGLHVVDDASPADWAARHDPVPRRRLLFVDERLAVAAR